MSKGLSLGREINSARAAGETRLVRPMVSDWISPLYSSSYTFFQLTPRRSATSFTFSSLVSGRHTFATEYLRRGGEIERLRRILGHTTYVMVMRYVHLDKGDLYRDFESCAPF